MTAAEKAFKDLGYTKVEPARCNDVVEIFAEYETSCGKSVESIVFWAPFPDYTANHPVWYQKYFQEHAVGIDQREHAAITLQLQEIEEKRKGEE